MSLETAALAVPYLARTISHLQLSSRLPNLLPNYTVSGAATESCPPPPPTLLTMTPIITLSPLALYPTSSSLVPRLTWFIVPRPYSGSTHSDIACALDVDKL